MAEVHIKEIMQYLSEKGHSDALPNNDSSEGFFLQINFNDPRRTSSSVPDEEYSNQVLTVDTAYGIATITFDEEGLLKSIDIC